MAPYRPKSLDELNNIYDKAKSAEKAIEKGKALFRDEKNDHTAIVGESIEPRGNENKAADAQRKSKEISGAVDSFKKQFSKADTKPSNVYSSSAERGFEAQAEQREAIEKEIKRETDTAFEPLLVFPEISKNIEQPTAFEAQTRHQNYMSAEAPVREGELSELMNEYIKVMSDDYGEDGEENARSSFLKRRRSKRKQAKERLKAEQEASSQQEAAIPEPQFPPVASHRPVSQEELFSQPEPEVEPIEEYIEPEQEFEPVEEYIEPEQEFEPVEEYIEPEQELEPVEEYIEPEQELESVEEYIEPEQEFEPVEEYIEPEQEFEPVEEYIEPEQEFEPVEEYIEPEQEIEPVEEYIEPEQELESVEEYTEPEQEFEPVEGYIEPEQDFEPVEEYIEPEQVFEPVEEYTEPEQELEPVEEYIEPEQEYEPFDEYDSTEAQPEEKQPEAENRNLFDDYDGIPVFDPQKMFAQLDPFFTKLEEPELPADEPTVEVEETFEADESEYEAVEDEAVEFEALEDEADEYEAPEYEVSEYEPLEPESLNPYVGRDSYPSAFEDINSHSEEYVDESEAEEAEQEDEAQSFEMGRVVIAREIKRKSKGKTAAKVLLSLLLVLVLLSTVAVGVVNTVLGINTGKEAFKGYYLYAVTYSYEMADINSGDLVICEKKTKLEDKDKVAYLDVESRSFSFGVKNGEADDPDSIGELLYDISGASVKESNILGVVSKTLPKCGKLVRFVIDNFIVLMASLAGVALVLSLILGFAFRPKKVTVIKDGRVVRKVKKKKKSKKAQKNALKQGKPQPKREPVGARARADSEVIDSKDLFNDIG